ncbi:MAG: hypothetical protein ACI89J_004416 [Hyphomicrobiaceae bacterium]|jgi:hypothetical protein
MAAPRISLYSSQNECSGSHDATTNARNRNWRIRVTRPFKIMLVSSLILASASQVVSAAQINTGGAKGAYHSTFCPSLVKQLDLLGKPSECLSSDGTGDNIRRVANNPDELGYGQLDVYALETPKYGGTRAFEMIRSDDVRECVFAVTRNKKYTNYGEIAVNADKLRIVLPPKSSGSAKTFEYLSKIDPDGLGQAKDVINADSTDNAIELALKNHNAVAFFVQFPDPSNERFRRIRQLSGHIVPVIDSVILRQKVDDQAIYFAQETSISQLKWLNLGRRVVTVCTPLVLFTGANRRITSREQRPPHRQLVLNIRNMRSTDLIPEASPIAKVLKKTRQLSARARFHFQELSLNARERARPFFDRMYRGAGHMVQLMIMKARPPEHNQGRIQSDGFN